MPALRPILALMVMLLALPRAAAAQDTGGFERLQGLKISLSHSVRIVEREGEGRVVHAALEEEYGRPVWQVNALSEQGMREYWVDAMSGRLLRIAELPLRGRVYSLLVGLTPDKIRNAKLNVTDAVTRAEADTRAKAELMEIDQPRSRMEYLVVLRDAERLHRIRMDADSGEIVFKD